MVPSLINWRPGGISPLVLEEFPVMVRLVVFQYCRRAGEEMLLMVPVGWATTENESLD
jgi:hypothetical protein